MVVLGWLQPLLLQFWPLRQRGNFCKSGETDCRYKYSINIQFNIYIYSYVDIYIYSIPTCILSSLSCISFMGQKLNWLRLSLWYRKLRPKWLFQRPAPFNIWQACWGFPTAGTSQGNLKVLCDTLYIIRMSLIYRVCLWMKHTQLLNSCNWCKKKKTKTEISFPVFIAEAQIRRPGIGGVSSAETAD